MNTRPHVLTRDQSRQVDQIAINELGMSGLVLMENAGRGVVDVMRGLGVQGPVAIVCGKGNNAGDGFVMARHLDLMGIEVEVILCGDPGKLRGDALANYRLLVYTDVKLTSAMGALTVGPAKPDFLVDAILGTGALGEPRSPMDQVIRSMNEINACRLALDIPSGLDADTGVPASSTFRADHTCTFVAAKPGLLTDQAAPYVGQIHVIPIGVPRHLLDRWI